MISKKIPEHLLFSFMALYLPLSFSATDYNIHSFYQQLTQKITSPWLSPLKSGHVSLQVGNYWSAQGREQHVNISGLIGDEYTLTHIGGSNGFVGLGYFIDGQTSSLFNMAYGVSAFYLAKTSVTGNVIQENLFTNLSYQYHVTHYPIYAIAKSIIPVKSEKYAITFDAGLGPNFMNTTGFKESLINNSGTLPDNAFSGKTTATFSVTTGAGFRVNNVFGKAPLECGYRFFYLGKGYFRNKNNQLLNTLSTGDSYANAAVCSLIV